MGRFRTVFRYLPRYRVSLAFGLLSILIGQALQNVAPQILREGLRQIEGPLGMGTDVDTQRVGTIALVYVAIMIVRSFFLWSMRFCTISASRNLEADLRRDFFLHMQSLDHRFFNRNRTGDLMSRATSDTEAVRSALGPAVMYITNSVVSVPLALGFMFYMEWRLTLLALIPLLFVAGLVKFVAPRIMALSREAQESMGRISTAAQENFAGVRVVKAYAREDREEEVFDKLSLEYLDANIRLAKIRGMMTGGIRAAGSAGILIVLGYCGLSFISVKVVGGKLDLATLIAFQAYQISLIWPMMAFGWVLAMFQRGAAALERIDKVMDSKSEVPEPEHPAELSKLDGAIRIRDLDFAFDEGQPTLTGINLDIPAGSALGIVGPTGCGKSTLVSLLSRTYAVPRGKLLLDGADINDLPIGMLRRGVAVVPQEAFLFSQTIGDNIAFGLEETADMGERVKKAAEVAALVKDVEGFPRGFDTRVGERGVTLSGGQKQRLAIARAVIREPSILVLDDCLSAVDSHTEQEILTGLREVIAGRTSIIVSHRISAVKEADEIIVLEDGRITARGTHDQLVENSEYYADTWFRQRLEEELGEID